MTAGMVSLYGLAAFLGVAPTVLRATLNRAGIRLSADSQASESDLARVFGPEAARELVRRAKDEQGEDGMETSDVPSSGTSLRDPARQEEMALE